MLDGDRERHLPVALTLRSWDGPPPAETLALVAEFHAGLYARTFAHQSEPLAAWLAVLAGTSRGYDACFELRVEGGAVVAAAICERYPISGCGLLTYLVVDEACRGRGLARELIAGARGELGELAYTFFEVERGGVERARYFQRQHGARRLDLEYVQPDLGSGRNPDLWLMVLPPFGETIAGDVVSRFLAEFYAVTEGGPPPDFALGERVRLCEV